MSNGLEEGIVFGAAELAAAVSEVVETTSNSSTTDLKSEPLVQDINSANPLWSSEAQAQLIENDISLPTTTEGPPDLKPSMQPNGSQTQVGAQGRVGNGVGVENRMPTSTSVPFMNPTVGQVSQMLAFRQPGPMPMGPPAPRMNPNGNQYPPRYSMQGTPGNSAAGAFANQVMMSVNNNAGSAQAAPNSPTFVFNPGANMTPTMQENWMDVAHITGTRHEVKYFFQTNEGLLKLPPNCPVLQIPEFAHKRVDVQPSQAYKFRVAAVNSRGRGPWSEITAFKTTVPGLPGAPNSVKVSKIEEGAKLSWEDSNIQCGPIFEYSVYLSVTPESAQEASQMCFRRVYAGPKKECTVSNQCLRGSYVDTSTGKPAVIFRIAARNAKSYGPATQVRWLQESASTIFSARPAARREVQY